MNDVIHNLCPQTWPLLDPGPEDLVNGITHGCIREEGHDGDHRCTCGESYPDTP